MKIQRLTCIMSCGHERAQSVFHFLSGLNCNKITSWEDHGKAGKGRKSEKEQTKKL